MIYRDFQDEKLSAYAMGCMRLPVIDGDDAKIDESAAAEMVDYALAHGVNYFDTAWGYHAGTSELVIGRALAKHPRDSFNLADKFPGYDVSNFGKTPEIFEKQLEKCQVDHFDFYLAHNVCELNIEQYLDDSTYGTISYLLEQKKAGRIRHLGFSIHGGMDVLERFLDAYGEHMEFCQVQLNYLDWEFQDAKGKVELLAKHGIPVWVMEPVRGGQLVNRLPESAREKLAAVNPDEAPVSWALRWLLSRPEVVTILSGASSLDQMKENIAVFDEAKPLTDEEQAAVSAAAAEITHGNVLPCTACRYCTSHCPLELDIPRLLELYNEHKVTGGGFIAPMAIGVMPEDKRPQACIGCGSCAAVCPQQIDIPAALADFADMLKA
ncbi:MAG TPA: aldo/keto reductase [Candidatus Aphodovivens excrementavium]|nr:aldo/keto reductase [Candidatus Aphodovivens excrementavium]